MMSSFFFFLASLKNLGILKDIEIRNKKGNESVKVEKDGGRGSRTCCRGRRCSFLNPLPVFSQHT